MRNLILSGCVLIAAALGALPATAADVRFTVTNAEAPGSVSWLLPASPSPDYAEPDFYFVVEGPILGTVTGSAGGDGQVLFEVFSFVTDGAGGGLNTFAFIALDALGPDFSIPYGFSLLGDQLFTGATDAPTFRLGTFVLQDACGCEPGVGDFTLTISAAVPEPGAWALMILGFGAAGVALRVRRAPAAAAS